MKPVLVLNSAYEPIHTISMKKAVKLIIRGKAVPEKTTPQAWCSANAQFFLPAVVRLVDYYRIPKRVFRMSKKNIMIRDRHTCQYCGNKYSSSTLTLDHIVPKSKGGKSTWENLVAACKPCNNWKADQTPEQAGMSLISKSSSSRNVNHKTFLRAHGDLREDWREYLFY